MEPDDRPWIDLSTAPAEAEPIVRVEPEPTVLEEAPGDLTVELESVVPETVGSEAIGSEAVESATVGSEAIGSEAIGSEVSESDVLAGIEADLAAVEEAMSGLDRIDSSQIGGAAAAAQVAAIVGSGRFDVTT